MNIPENLVDEENVLQQYQKRKKFLELFIAPSVFMKYSGLLKLYDNSNYKIHIIEKDYSKLLYADNISKCKVKLSVVESKHEDLVSNAYSTGIILDLGNNILIYTGDTGWSSAISKQYERIVHKVKNKNIILVAHLGGFEKNEKYFICNKRFDDLLYDNHLGRIGLARLCEILNPAVCLISEFGEEFKGSRVEVTKVFNDAHGHLITKYLPADIGLKIDLTCNKIKAIGKINDISRHIICDYYQPQKIDVGVIPDHDSIFYFNSDLTESNCLLALKNGYKEKIG